MKVKVSDTPRGMDMRRWATVNAEPFASVTVSDPEKAARVRAKKISARVVKASKKSNK